MKIRAGLIHFIFIWFTGKNMTVLNIEDNFSLFYVFLKFLMSGKSDHNNNAEKNNDSFSKQHLKRFYSKDKSLLSPTANCISRLQSTYVH